MEHKDKSASRASVEAMREMDAHCKRPDAETIPEGEAEGHTHSQAAHLHEAGIVHTKPAGEPRHKASPGERRDPQHDSN